MVVGLAVFPVLASACGGSSPTAPTTPAPITTGVATSTAARPTNVYAHTLSPSQISPVIAGLPLRVYVPNSESDTVSVIDPATFKVIDQFPTGREPQHVTPSWDLRELYADADLGDSLTPIDPFTQKPGPNLSVPDPYNLYFTPDGSKAIVVAERERRLDFRDPHTFGLIKSVPIPLPIDGVDHMDFSADGSYLMASAEFSGDVVKVDTVNMVVLGSFKVGGAPVDVRLSPDGSVFFVANQRRNGVSVIDGNALTELSFIPTGRGAHGLYLSRDSTKLYVANRGGDGVSVIDFATRKVVSHWPFSGSPDMGGVSADGSQLWLSGRYNGEVYVIDTTTGQLLHRIPVGKGPHGLCFYPQPGRYSLGHTGNFR